ncbi:5548_t:CDS:2 [Acaulospora morrowiae]|uniref:5548_t:CDS:1 n=1 Tax=Acaulospora morrowiae TaxID=94023 RepID=A0A9N8VED9_9GLOM|nr:5548_t:CDS:2 [Acaulospora morrowiae]
MRGFRGFRSSRNYIQLQEDNGFIDAQFRRPVYPVPWNSIILAIVLFVMGSLGIIFGSLIMTGVISSEDWLDRGKPFLFLGSLLFIPDLRTTHTKGMMDMILIKFLIGKKLRWTQETFIALPGFV